MFKRFWSIFTARNKEYYRDRAAFGWNFLFPFLIIVGFAASFQDDGRAEYKIGIIPPKPPVGHSRAVPDGLKTIRIARLIDVGDRETGFDKLRHHRLDLLVEAGSAPVRYWINQRAPKGLIAEALVLKALAPPGAPVSTAVRAVVDGSQIRYIDWLFPGIIAMSMMFSALYGVGYTIVRYRKNGVLKRFKATPLTSFEYLAAQVASRLFLILASNMILYAGCAIIFRFKCAGSYLDLLIVFALGSVCIISLGLIVAARIGSEELANGILNLISWPMMFLSEVWFPLEGASDWVATASQLLPLRHVTEAMRRIITDGAGLADLTYPIGMLCIMTVVFMAIGSVTFKWTET